MNTELFASLLNGRPAGAKKWQARCPAHDDGSPSLHICEGRDGRVLLHCFAGCTLDQILAALGFGKRDLFAGPPPSKEEAGRRVAERLAKQERITARRMERGSLLDEYRRLCRVGNCLGAKLARIADNAPEGDELTRLFHETTDRLHRLEARILEIEK